MKADTNEGHRDFKFPRTKADFSNSLHIASGLAYSRGFNHGKEDAQSKQQYEVTQAKIAIMHEAAALAQANAKLTYALSQIVAEKKGFGA